MPYTHDEQKYEPKPPGRKFDWLLLVIFVAVLVLIYLVIRYHDILF